MENNTRNCRRIKHMNLYSRNKKMPAFISCHDTNSYYAIFNDSSTSVDFLEIKSFKIFVIRPCYLWKHVKHLWDVNIHLTENILDAALFRCNKDDKNLVSDRDSTSRTTNESEQNLIPTTSRLQTSVWRTLQAWKDKTYVEACFLPLNGVQLVKSSEACTVASSNSNGTHTIYPDFTVHCACKPYSNCNCNAPPATRLNRTENSSLNCFIRNWLQVVFLVPSQHLKIETTVSNLIHDTQIRCKLDRTEKKNFSQNECITDHTHAVK